MIPKQRRYQYVKAGDRSVYPFNHPFTDQEKRVFSLIGELRKKVAELRTELVRTAHNACEPPENYDPSRMDEFEAIEENLRSLDDQLRWIPGGVYRHE
jgi:hypothetical protein